MHFQRQKSLVGWGLFLVSLVVYLLTLEPTLSLWDCGEFLVSAYKLEICHAPGAPLFMLIGRVFSLLAGSDTERVAIMINAVSALSSAGTVMLLFWILVWLMEKMVPQSKGAILLASGVGALAFAFTDSFWFSAVEAEVYALSSLFMALVLWAATRWEREADEPYANRWMLLIFFFTGLSIGVHLLNLLVLPTVALIVYFRKYQPSWKGIVIVLGASGAFIILLMKVFIPGVFSLAGPIELLAVNQLGLPVNSGFYFYVLVLAGILAGGIVYSHRRYKPMLNLVLLCLVFLMIGYTSYFVPLIRSSANPPVDQGNPETTFELINYLNRENYGSRPILYGETYGSVPRSYHERISYLYDGERYIPTKLNPKVTYEEGTTSFFPRMNSKEEAHRKAYQSWVDVKGKRVNYQTKEGSRAQTTIPTFRENFLYFWRYQLGHMYWRYFLWNFVGRQNDIQGYGEVENGNWQSGIPLVDAPRLGRNADLPEEQLQNEGRNSYFFLPFLLGLLGLAFHYRKDKRTFLEMLVLFAIMSIGLVVYLNEIPITPRERDYVYVGSFFVFSIWIGMGALAVFQLMSSKLKPTPALLLTGVLTLAVAPGILLQQNRDDHDRSGRYTARDLARNYLMCCEPNAILFTHADNDTYPLWYCQEVEGIRQDVRVVVMPYLNAGWYTEQISRKIYENEGVKLTVPVDQYVEGEVDYLPIVPKIKTDQDMQKVLHFVANDSSQTKVTLQSGEKLNYIPVEHVHLAWGDQKIAVQLNKDYLMRNELAFWDILSSNINERPIYFTSYADPRLYGLESYLQFDGLVYRLIPERSEGTLVLDMGKVDTEKLYANLMEKCHWDSLKRTDVYFDWHHRRLFASAQIRPAFYRLAKALADEHKDEQAFEVLQEIDEILPFRNWPLDYYSVLIGDLYFEVGQEKAGEKQVKKLAFNLEEWIHYYQALNEKADALVMQELQMKLYLYQTLVAMAKTHQLEIAPVMNERLSNYMAMWQQ